MGFDAITDRAQPNGTSELPQMVRRVISCRPEIQGRLKTLLDLFAKGRMDGSIIDP